MCPVPLGEVGRQVDVFWINWMDGCLVECYMSRWMCDSMFICTWHKPDYGNENCNNTTVKISKKCFKKSSQGDCD